DESDTESTPIESIRSTINQNRDQPRGNQRNWNNLKSQQLGKDFVMQNKACYKCGSFEHLKVNCNKNKWVNKGKNWSRVNYTQGNLTPKAILLKSGTKTIAPNRSFSTARTSLNVAQPKMKSFVKSAHSNVKRPFERKAVAKNKIWVPTVRTKNPTVGLKVPTANDDTDGEDEEHTEDEEEGEHPAPTDSSVVDPVPSTGDTEVFETDESAPTPRSPQTMVPFSQ
ncbi:hypothetical protein Tco_0588015, partial [Tanacetum coccineum]